MQTHLLVAHPDHPPASVHQVEARIIGVDANWLRARWRIEGPWRWITAIGVRRSVRHGDITFGGSHRGGVRLDFTEPVEVGLFHAPALYVTVEDLEGFAAALTAHGIAGVDARERAPRRRPG